MPISLQCPECGKGYRLRDELAGKRVRCGCGTETTVPAAPTSPDEAPQADANPYSSPMESPPRRRKRRDQGSDKWRIVVGVLSIVYGTVMVPLILVLQLSIVRTLVAAAIVVGGVLILRRHKQGPAWAGLSCLFFCFFRVWFLFLGLLSTLSTGELKKFLVLLVYSVIVYAVPVFITIWCIRQETAKKTDTEFPL